MLLEVITIKKPIKPMSNVISALTARSQFGQLLDEVENRRRSFVIKKRGSPKAILLGIQDYIRLAAPEPEVLKRLGEASIRRGTDKLTMRQIDRVIKAARTSRQRVIEKSKLAIEVQCPTKGASSQAHPGADLFPESIRAPPRNGTDAPPCAELGAGNFIFAISNTNPTSSAFGTVGHEKSTVRARVLKRFRDQYNCRGRARSTHLLMCRNYCRLLEESSMLDHYNEHHPETGTHPSGQFSSGLSCYSKKLGRAPVVPNWFYSDRSRVPMGRTELFRDV